MAVLKLKDVVDQKVHVDSAMPVFSEIVTAVFSYSDSYSYFSREI